MMKHQTSDSVELPFGSMRATYIKQLTFGNHIELLQGI